MVGTPLGLHLGQAHGPAQLAVFGALFAALAAVGYVGFRRARTATTDATPTGPAATGAAIMPYLAFGTVAFAALVPLAAGLYLLTSGAWTAAERAWLHRPATAEAAPAADQAADQGRPVQPAR